ncbi:hypothetical protein DFR28_1021007 [Arenicella xantha]|uniref:Uncharacterized protein n=1 Tax=Arenicella xantha TaxID=644221 RepID=A0A395JP57_9GAMM|nr:hypothetical protein DFR28_1021007 [Arenicella xantha]
MQDTLSRLSNVKRKRASLTIKAKKKVPMQHGHYRAMSTNDTFSASGLVVNYDATPHIVMEPFLLFVKCDPYIADEQ